VAADTRLCTDIQLFKSRSRLFRFVFFDLCMSSCQHLVRLLLLALQRINLPQACQGP